LNKDFMKPKAVCCWILIILNYLHIIFVFFLATKVVP